MTRRGPTTRARRTGASAPLMIGPRGLALALAFTLALAACAQGESPAGAPPGRSGELMGEVIADAAAYPGQPGGTVGAVALTPAEAADLWSAVGFSGSAPASEGEAVAVVAGGESGSCPWQPQGALVADDGEVVTIDLGQRGEQPCTDDWSPRAIAISLPADRVAADPQLRVVLDGAEQDVGPLEVDDDHRADIPDGSPAGSPFLLAEVEVRADEGAEPSMATYACDADGSSEDGEGDEACAALVQERSWLLEGDPADQMCTQQYGGPQVARLRGHVDGQPFERRLDRADGCGIDRWDRLEAALGEAD